jgi:hypothetical protein
MSNNPNQVMQGLRRLSARSEAAADQMNDFVRRQANGEQPDGDEFIKLLQQRSTTHDAMAAQFKLIEKPMRTVLQETK